jgi:hypothetical protein
LNVARGDGGDSYRHGSTARNYERYLELGSGCLARAGEFGEGATVPNDAASAIEYLSFLEDCSNERISERKTLCNFGWPVNKVINRKVGVHQPIQLTHPFRAQLGDIILYNQEVYIVNLILVTSSRPEQNNFDGIAKTCYVACCNN